ncbi:hypothetical protein [Streptomyces cinereoruber]|uniref:hypothetical protein n=1 Tax=Streptomyces cinereoruber TaxID=67260 RepID=UPI003C2C4323
MPHSVLSPLPPPTVLTLDTEQVKWNLAFHEAGHSVAGLVWGVRGLTPQLVAVEHEGRHGFSGHTHFEVAPGLEAVTHMAAGGRADRLYLKRTELWSLHRQILEQVTEGEHDRAHAENLLGQCVDWKPVYATVESTLREVWEDVERVAAELHAHERVTDDRLRDLAPRALALLADRAPDPDAYEEITAAWKAAGVSP